MISGVTHAIRAEERTNLPSSSLQHLGEGKLLVTPKAQLLIDLIKKLIQKSHGHSSPLNDDIVIGSEKGHNLHVWLTLYLSIFFVGFYPALHVSLLQYQQTHVNEETTISIFGQTG